MSDALLKLRALHSCEEVEMVPLKQCGWSAGPRVVGQPRTLNRSKLDRRTPSLGLLGGSEAVVNGTSAISTSVHSAVCSKFGMPATDALVEGEIGSVEDPSPGQQLPQPSLSFSFHILHLPSCCRSLRQVLLQPVPLLPFAKPLSLGMIVSA